MAVPGSSQRPVRGKGWQVSGSGMASSAYEEQRAARVAANQRRLAELVPAAGRTIPARAARKPKPKRKAEPAGPPAERRRTQRLRGAPAPAAALPDHVLDDARAFAAGPPKPKKRPPTPTVRAQTSAPPAGSCRAEDADLGALAEWVGKEIVPLDGGGGTGVSFS